jgi:hypothetical protein
MEAKVSEELIAFTKPTQYCDSDHTEIQAAARKLAEGANSAAEQALRIHRYVRDRYKFGFTPVTEKASDTLNGELGWCVTKTNLQIALLRSLGIPARYHQVALSKTSLKGIISNTIYRIMKDPIWFHPWCECFLDGTWIACDLFIDRFTYQAALNKGLYDVSYFPTVEWDGKTDLLIVNHWFKEDRGIHANYDPVVKEVDKELSQGPAFVLNTLVRQSNRFTKRFREKLG